MLLCWLVETRLICWKTVIEEGSHDHTGEVWYPVYFEMDWIRYCEGEINKSDLKRVFVIYFFLPVSLQL